MAAYRLSVVRLGRLCRVDGVAAVIAGRVPWVLEVAEGRWRGEPPRGRLRMQVAGVSRSTTPGFVIVSGWRQFEGEKQKFCRVVVRAELVRRPGDQPGRRGCR